MLVLDDVASFVVMVLDDMALGLRLVDFGVDFVSVDVWLLLLSCTRG